METVNLSTGSGPQPAISPLLFGQFIEFIETCIDGGIYDPGNPRSDEAGIREDVAQLCARLASPILRYPGGTYITVHHWKDMIGPKARRPRTLNRVWGGVIDGGFGTAEFIQFCRRIGAEPMLCVNMASGTAEEAADWVEYCNGTADTHYANLRRQHGYPEPFGVKYWCIGNECYAEPDIGVQHDVQRYIRDAWEFTKYMKLTDPDIRLVFVGSDDELWNRAVLDALSPVCDYFSLHTYAGEGGMGPYGPFRQLQDILAKTDRLAELVRSYPARVSGFSPWYRFPPRQEAIRLCLDEWNLWDPAPRPGDRYGLLTTYNWRDALWTACFLIALIRRCDAVGIACMAQLVNVLAPIVADDQGSHIQTTYYPLHYFRAHCGGRLLPWQSPSPTFDGGAAGQLEQLHLCATAHDDGKVTLLAVNIGSQPLALALPHSGGVHIQLTAPALDSANSRHSDVVCGAESAIESATVLLVPHSIHVLTLHGPV